MKLNQDCVRDFLLYLEETLTLENYLNINCYTNDSLLPNYSIDDIRYTTLKLIEAGYIDAKTRKFLDTQIPEIRICSITYQGHLFLDNIRDDKVYSKTKSILSTLKSVSIEVFSETASKVITSLISKQLNLID